MGICRDLFDRYRLPVSRSQAFAVLRNDRRRWVIVSLDHRSRPVPFAELVDAVAERERRHTDLGPSAEIRSTVYTALYQTHVPRLDRLGIVDHDEETDTIALTDAGESLMQFMRARSTIGSVWAVLFLGLSITYAGFIVAAVALDALTETLALAVVVVAGYAILAVAAALSTVWCDDPIRSCLD